MVCILRMYYMILMLYDRVVLPLFLINKKSIWYLYKYINNFIIKQLNIDSAAANC
jgi:hypothetical protein